MAQLTFPYTLHCPKCKAKLKIKSPDLVGKRMPCPSCKTKIDVVTPEEDGWVPYEVEDPRIDKKRVEEEKEEEIFAREEEKEKERIKRKWDRIKWTVSVIIYAGMLGGVAYGFYYFVVKDYGKNIKDKKDDGGEAFGKLFNVN